MAGQDRGRPGRWRRQPYDGAAACRITGDASSISLVTKDVLGSYPPDEHAELLARFVTDGYVCLRPQVRPGLHEAVVGAADAAYAAASFGGQQNSSPIGNNILPEVPELQEVFGCREVDAAVRAILGDGYIAHPHRRPHQNDPGSAPQTLHKDSHAGFEVHRSHVPWVVMAMYYPRAVGPKGAPTSVCAGTQYYSGEERFDARHLAGGDAQTTLQRWGSEEKHLVCEAGTVAILHNDLWHRGTANRSDRRRWMFCFMFMRAAGPEQAVPAPPMAAPGPQGAIARHVWRWLLGDTTPLLQAKAVGSDPAVILDELMAASDDAERLGAAYRLAEAAALGADPRGDGACAADVALARALRDVAAEPVRRAAKFGAAAACYSQLLCGRSGMAQELLRILADSSDPGACACAARALFECGAWCRAPPALRLQAAEVLAAAAMAPHRAAEGRGRAVPPAVALAPTPGSSLGVVKVWKADQDYGFVRPKAGGPDVFVASAAFGGGELMAGSEVRYDVVQDPRSGRPRAATVSGPGVDHRGGRRVGWRNARASAIEAIAVLPQGAEDPSAATAAATLAARLAAGARAVAARRLVGDPARLEEGEALVAAALGSVRLLTRCGPAQRASWWADGGLRCSLLAVVRAGEAARPPPGARRPGAGGTPGADNGLRYALAYALEALRRSGDDEAMFEAASLFPDVVEVLSQGRCMEEALRLRRCHLTTPEHTF